MVAGATAGLFIVIGTVTTAGADPIGDCSTTSGVIVAVDFSAWGGHIERGCDATLTTGFDALHRAGFTSAGDTQDGPGFICRIDDEPSPAVEPCVATPPAHASWSYWHADVGQDTWSYSLVGAMNYHPAAGSVDAWTFGSTDIGAGGQPTFPPSAVRATNGVGSGSTTTTSVVTTTSTVPPAPPAGSTAGGAGPPTTTTRATGPSATGATGPRGAQTPSPSTTAPGPTTSSTLAGAPASANAVARSTPRIVDAAPAAIRPRSAGSPAPLLTGVGVVVVLAAAAGMAAWRRRRIG